MDDSKRNRSTVAEGTEEAGKAPPEIVLICGSRDFDNESLMREVIENLKYLFPNFEILNGGARGADRMATKIALELGIPVTEVPANWKRHGKLAGLLRNNRMLDMGPSLVVAFYKEGSLNIGTTDMVRKAENKGVLVVEYKA